MNFKVGDICIGAPGERTDGWVITGLVPERPRHPYTAVSLCRKKFYRLAEQGLIRIGELSAELDVNGFLSLLNTSPPLPDASSIEYLEGQRRAEMNAAFDLTDFREQWKRLAQARPGDRLATCLDGKHETVTFHCVLSRGEKYVFRAANKAGKIYRYPLKALVVEETLASTPESEPVRESP